MTTLIDLLRGMWGNTAPLVAEEYVSVATLNKLFMSDIAVFCNAAAPIQGTSEFDRGVEEGKRRVWLHIARMSKLTPDDFIPIAHGESAFNRR